MLAGFKKYIYPFRVFLGTCPNSNSLFLPYGLPTNLPARSTYRKAEN